MKNFLFVLFFSILAFQFIVSADQLMFMHAPNGDWSKYHKDTIINYKSWDGSNWTAKLENNFRTILFIHAPNGDWSKCHKDMIINYKSWDGSNWTAQILKDYRHRL